MPSCSGALAAITRIRRTAVTSSSSVIATTRSGAMPFCVAISVPSSAKPIPSMPSNVIAEGADRVIIFPASGSIAKRPIA